MVKIVTCLKYLIDTKYQDKFYRFVSGTWISVIIMVILLMFCFARYLFPTVSSDVSASFLRCFHGFLRYFMFPFSASPVSYFRFCVSPPAIIKDLSFTFVDQAVRFSRGEHPDKWAVTEFWSYHSFKENFFLFWV